MPPAEIPRDGGHARREVSGRGTGRGRGRPSMGSDSCQNWAAVQACVADYIANVKMKRKIKHAASRHLCRGNRSCIEKLMGMTWRWWRGKTHPV